MADLTNINPELIEEIIETLKFYADMKSYDYPTEEQWVGGMYGSYRTVRSGDSPVEEDEGERATRVLRALKDAS